MCIKINVKKFLKEFFTDSILSLTGMISGIVLFLIGIFKNEVLFQITGITIVFLAIVHLIRVQNKKLVPKPEPLPEPAPPVVPEPIIEKPKPPWFGASVYELIQMEIELIKAFLKQLKKAGGNATEIFLVHSHNNNTFQPYKYDRQKKQFDLEVWNPMYWVSFKCFLTTCKIFGIVPFIRIHDWCSIKNSELAKYYCFLNNVQGFTSVYDEGLYPYYSILNARIPKELKDAGVEQFFIIPMSECDGMSDQVWNFNHRYLLDMLYFGTDLRQYDVPEDQIIISAATKHFDRLMNLGCRLEVHGIADVEDLVTAIQLYGNNIFGNGDGCNGNGIKSWNGYGEPSIDQAIELGKYIRNNDLFGYIYKAREGYQTRGEVHPELVKFSALKALVGK